MMRFARYSVRRLTHETHGAEIAEAAAVLPLMFMILLGIFWFGQAFSIYGAITRAAQDGARAGAAPSCTTCTALTAANRAANADAAVQSALTIAKLDPTLAQQPSPVPSFTSCGGPTTCDGGSSNFCVQAPVQLSDTVTGSGVCGVSVSFQYPFQFWLPFTSLNKQKIWISASARVRLENQ
jgi:Flp pilus assembly protein TadG